MPLIDVARRPALRSNRDPLIRGALKEAERSTPLSNLKKLARHTAGHAYRFAVKPGLIWEVAGAEKKSVLAALPDYPNSLAPDHQLIFDRYQPVDVGFKLRGPGTVGTRDYVRLFSGRRPPDPFFL